MRATAPPLSQRPPIRVLVVDDSSVARMVMTRVLRSVELFDVTSAVADGREAVAAVQREADKGSPIEVVLLDVEMPTLGGLEALPHLLSVVPAPRVIMASSHTRRGAAISLRALTLGASDYVCKPDPTLGQSPEQFARELVEKVQVWAAAFVRQNGPKGRHANPPRQPARTGPEHSATSGSPKRPERTLGRWPSGDPGHLTPVQVVAIGASTGGPQALSSVLGHLRKVPGPPLLITQHMPATFTPILAEHLSRVLELPCAEGVDGEPVVNGRAFVAPGGKHMLVRGDARGIKYIHLTEDPPENFCRPAVDPMLRSVAECYGNGALALILTGMGQDGLNGCNVIARCGGRVLVQDEATSIVWGMPGAVARNGVAHEVLPLPAIGPRMLRLLGGAGA